MKLFKEIGRGLKKVAKFAGRNSELIATVAGGPAAGKLVGMITKSVGADNFEDAVRIIEEHPDPESVLAHVQAENYVKLQELAYESTEGARKMYGETVRSNDVWIRRAPVIFAYLILGCWVASFATVLFLCFGETGNVPEGFKALIFTGFGAITNELKGVTHFFFGSSEGSKQKSIDLRRM